MQKVAEKFRQNLSAIGRQSLSVYNKLCLYFKILELALYPPVHSQYPPHTQQQQWGSTCDAWGLLLGNLCTWHARRGASSSPDGKSRRLEFPGTPLKATYMARVCALPVTDAQCISCEMGGMAAAACCSMYGACHMHAGQFRPMALMWRHNPHLVHECTEFACMRHLCTKACLMLLSLVASISSGLHIMVLFTMPTCSSSLQATDAANISALAKDTSTCNSNMLWRHITLPSP